MRSVKACFANFFFLPSCAPPRCYVYCYFVISICEPPKRPTLCGHFFICCASGPFKTAGIVLPILIPSPIRAPQDSRDYAAHIRAHLANMRAPKATFDFVHLLGTPKTVGVMQPIAHVFASKTVGLCWHIGFCPCFVDSQDMKRWVAMLSTSAFKRLTPLSALFFYGYFVDPQDGSSYVSLQPS